MREENAGAHPERESQPPFDAITPELLEWARGHFTEEEFLAAWREFEVTGGLELKDFLHELEGIVNSDG